MKNYRGLIAMVFAIGLVIVLLAGIAGIIWRGNQISMQGDVVIGMLMGAIVIIGSVFLGTYLTYFATSGRRRRWPGEKSSSEEDTLVP